MAQRLGGVRCYARFVSKKVRGSAVHRRPGTRAPSDRPASARRVETSESVSQLEAAEVIAEDVVEHKPAMAAAELERATRASTHHRPKIKAGSVLAERAANEYVYVAQDLRRIIGVSALLMGAMIVLWLALVVFKVIPLPFY